MNPWDNFTVSGLTGLKPATPASQATSVAPGLSASAGPAPQHVVKVWNPENPLWWFGVLAAATVGLIAASSQVRLGPVKVSGSVGK